MEGNTAEAARMAVAQQLNVKLFAAWTVDRMRIFVLLPSRVQPQIAQTHTPLELIVHEPPLFGLLMVFGGFMSDEQSFEGSRMMCQVARLSGSAIRKSLCCGCFMVSFDVHVRVFYWLN